MCEEVGLCWAIRETRDGAYALIGKKKDRFVGMLVKYFGIGRLVWS